MNERDYYEGFKQCKSEILSLRKQNREMDIELTAINKVLHAVNSHHEPDHRYSETEDIVRTIDHTLRDLEPKTRMKME